MQHERDKSDLTFPTDFVAIVFGIALFSSIIFFFNETVLSDPDSYWHMVTGRWIWAEHAFPRQDIFSHTAFGQPWTNMEWLSQIIIFFFYSSLGWQGLVLMAALAIALTWTVMYLLLTRRMRATVALGVSAMSFVFASPHFLARPHLLSFPVIVIWAAFLAKACDERRRPSFWLLPLMMLWANLHGAFTLGLVLAAGLALEAIVAAPAIDRRRVVFDWAIFGICALAAGCITPYGYQYVLETINVLNLGPVLEQNGEWRPMDVQREVNQEVILLALTALALTFGAKIKFVRVLLLIGILHFGLRHVRGLAMVALMWPFLLAGPLQSQFAFLRPSIDPRPLFAGRKSGLLPATLSIAAIAIVVAALGATYTRVRPIVNPQSNISPQAAVDYVLQQNVGGPVYNDFDFGGYLIFRGIKTFIDGRTLPFGKDFSVAYFDATKIRNLAKLEAMTDAYKVTWTLVRPGSTEAYYFDHSPHWRQLFADDVAVVHVRR